MSNSFPTKENPKLCQNSCGTKIYLSKKDGRYLPFELDGNVHICKKREPIKQEFTLEAVLKKLQSVGITVKLEELMNNDLWRYTLQILRWMVRRIWFLPCLWDDSEMTMGMHSIYADLMQDKDTFSLPVETD